MALRSFYIQTFGCQMNVNDSDWLARALKSRGFVAAPFREAEIFIVNTCSVREKPEQKVYSELGRIASFAKAHGRRDITVAVGGCVAQQVGADLSKRFPQVRLVFGTDGIAQAPRAIEQLAEDPALRINLLDFASHYEERDNVWQGGAPPTAFVNIMQGCDNFCTYCIVPFVRGRQKSRKPEAVLDECRQLIDHGAREITLLGQNVNSYGHDSGDMPFYKLLHAVAALPGLQRLRFVTPHPKDIAPEVIESFADLPVLCPRLHLPLQSGSDAILAKMGRRYTVRRYMDIVEALKKARPDILFTTDIIVGFPGETEEDFTATLAAMRGVGFVSSFSFVYSDRPGAKAVLLPGKVDRAVSLERLSRLQGWQNSFSENLLAEQTGKVYTVLIENRSLRAPLPDDGLPAHETTPVTLENGWESWQGKTGNGLIVNVPLPPHEQAVFQTHNKTQVQGQAQACESSTWAGAMVSVSIEAAARHSLKGKLAGVAW